MTQTDPAQVGLMKLVQMLCPNAVMNQSQAEAWCLSPQIETAIKDGYCVEVSIGFTGQPDQKLFIFTDGFFDRVKFRFSERSVECVKSLESVTSAVFNSGQG